MTTNQQELRPGEEDELRHERDRLANAEALSSLARQALALLDEGSPEMPAITDLMGGNVDAMFATLILGRPSYCAPKSISASFGFMYLT